MNASPQRNSEFTWMEGFAYLCGAIGVQLSSELIAQWSAYYYSPTEGGSRIIYVSLGLIGVCVVVGRVFDAITDPLIGVWSDITRSIPGRWRIIPIKGRRRPFIFWGAVLMTFTSIAFWYPPDPFTSQRNFIYATLVICLHWLFFTICSIPLMSLGPEIARTQEGRMKLGVWWAVGMVIGLVLAIVVPPELFVRLSPGYETSMIEGVQIIASPEGYQRTGILLAIVALILFQFPVWLIRERYHDVLADESGDKRIQQHAEEAWGEMSDSLRVRAFQLYLAAFFLFNLGFLGMQRALPNYAEVGLGGNEETVTKLLAPYVLTALLTALVMYPLLPILTKRLRLKWLFFIAMACMGMGLPLMYPIAIMDAAGSTKTLLAALVFGFCGIGQGINFVIMTALLGEIIDLDEHSSGKRREAVFNGVAGIGYKLGQAAALGLSTQIMAWFGNSVQNPRGILIIGPIAGVFCLLSLVVIWNYPVLSVTRRSIEKDVT